MRRATLAALFLSTLSCAASPAAPSGEARFAPLDRALAAMGGAEALAGADGLLATGTVRHWEPEQSAVPGGAPRLAGDSAFVLTRSFTRDSARIQWTRNLVYPAPREYRFAEVVTPAGGWVDGVDTTARTNVLTHHHMDHVGGARTFVAEGAEVLVGAGVGAHVARMFRAPHRTVPDALEQDPRPATVTEVADRAILGSGDRTVEVIRIDNPHAEGMLIGWVPHARLGWVTDLWSPGRDKLGDRPSAGQAALVASLRRLGIAPERFAGGHGGVAPYAPLAELAAKAGP